MVKNKHDKKRKHRIAINISDRDYELLKLYATSKNATKGHIVKQLLHAELQKFKSSIGGLPVENQLNLFISPQTDIFDIIDEKI